ncbi:MAG TPA: hypothetical protein VGK73_38715 [Polyangiaceae bacterium]
MKTKRVGIEKGLAEKLELFDPQGRPVENPTVAQFREAIVQVAKQSGSNTLQMTVHGIYIAILMAGDDEVPDSLSLDYANGLVSLAEEFLKIAKEGKAKLIMSSRGGSA